MQTRRGRPPSAAPPVTNVHCARGGEGSTPEAGKAASGGPRHARHTTWPAGSRSALSRRGARVIGGAAFLFSSEPRRRRALSGRIRADADAARLSGTVLSAARIPARAALRAGALGSEPETAVLSVEVLGFGLCCWREYMYYLCVICSVYWFLCSYVGVRDAFYLFELT